MKVSKRNSPSRRRTCSTTAASAFGGCPPTCSSASTSELNSCPSGSPAKRTRASCPARRRAKDGESSPSFCRISSRTRSDEAAMSPSSSSISRDASPSSGDATISTGWASRSR